MTRPLLGLAAAALMLSACGREASTLPASAVTSPAVLPAAVRDQWQGKVVLADFWATWCGPCLASSPNVQILHDRFADDQNVLIVGVHADDGVENPRSYLDENGYTYGFVEKGQDIANAFGVNALPTFVLLDQHGNEVMRHVGMMQLKTRERFEAEIIALRSGG